MDKVKDAIIEDFENSMEAWRGLATTDNMFLIGRIDAYEMAIATVKHKFKTVGHGKWREETEYYDDEYSECNVRKVFACSLCGRTEKYKQPYCHCGARMDGGK